MWIDNDEAGIEKINMTNEESEGKYAKSTKDAK